MEAVLSMFPEEELQNRCLTLTVDESREQTKSIHTLQRQARILDGLRLKKQRQKTLTLLRNVQRLLVAVDVVNPYADQLTFTAERTRTRRDHEKYLTLIDSIALLHQHQRKTETLSATGGSACGGKTENQEQRTTNQEPPCYITVTLDDIKLANQLAPELLGRSLDELSPQTRNLLEHAKTIVRERMAEEETEQQFIFFSRRDIRERLGWSVTQVRIHLERLRSFEYIESRSGRPGSAFQYCLLTDCNEPGKTSQVGLLDIEKLQLRHKPDGKNRHLAGGGKKQPVRVKTL